MAPLRSCPARALSLPPYNMAPAPASLPYLSPLSDVASSPDMLTGCLRVHILRMPFQAPGKTGFFSGASASIFTVPDSSGYGDKRGRNKPFGPGGSTRRLHHMP